MIRGGKKLYGGDSDEEVGPDFTVYASAIDFRDKLRVDTQSPSTPSPKSISSSVITRYLNSLSQPEPPNRAVETTARPASASRLPAQEKSKQRSVKLTKAKPTLAYNTVTLTVNPDDNGKRSEIVSPTNSTLRNSGKYNYHLEDNYPEPDNDTPQTPKLDLELIDLDYYDSNARRTRATPELRNDDAVLVKRVTQTKKPPPPTNTPTKRASIPKITSTTRAKPPSALLTISTSFSPAKEPTSPTLTPTSDSEPPSSPSFTLARSRPATPNTLLKRVSARPTTPNTLGSRPSSSASTRSSAQIRPNTASSSISSRSTTKKKLSKSIPPQESAPPAEPEPASPSEELLAATVHKYLNTEYFSDDDEYRSLPTNTDALSEKQISVLVRAVTLDVDLFLLCYFDDYARNILNKRMSLATKETSLVDKMENSVAVKAQVLNFLGENGLIEKVRTILKGVQKREDAKITDGNILSPEDAASVFPPMVPELYALVESAVWKILRREMKVFLRSNFEPYLNTTMDTFLGYISTRVLKGKVKRFASERLAEHFTARELTDLHLAISDPAFVCESEERVWWNEEDSKVGWYDSDSKLTLPVLANWMRKIDKFFLKGVLSVKCYICKAFKLKFFDEVKCPTCTAHNSALEAYNRYYCKEQCLHTHMNSSHSVYIAAPSQRNEMCEVCRQHHELYICKKCHSVLDFHGQHRMVILHERSCTGPK